MTAATTQHVYVPGLGGWCLCCGSRSSDPRHVPARSAAANEPDYGTIDVPATPTTDEEIAKLPVFDLDTHTASAACSYCGDEDLPTRPLVTDEGLTIFVCPDCANGEDE